MFHACINSGVLNLQMAKGNVGSLLVFDPEKIDFASDDKVTSAAGDAVVGIVTERGQCCMPGFSTAINKTCQALCCLIADCGFVPFQIT